MLFLCFSLFPSCLVFLPLMKKEQRPPTPVNKDPSPTVPLSFPFQNQRERECPQLPASMRPFPRALSAVIPCKTLLLCRIRELPIGLEAQALRLVSSQTQTTHSSCSAARGARREDGRQSGLRIMRRIDVIGCQLFRKSLSFFSLLIVDFLGGEVLTLEAAMPLQFV